MGPGSQEHRYIHVLVVLMCVTSGSIDAIAITALGNAFVTVITGNVVFLGVAIGSHSAGHALACLVAVLGYMAGTALSTRLLAANSDVARPWQRRVLIGLSAELVLFLAVAVSWLSLDGHPAATARDGMLVVAGAAMGIQGVAARQFPVAVSTTYLTGALTGLVEALAARRPLSTSESSTAWGLVSLIAGAALALVILDANAAAGILLPVASLTIALGVVARLEARSRLGQSVT